MKVLKFAFAAALLASPLAVSAQPAMNDHRVVRTERTIERPDGRTRTVERTVIRHDDRRDWNRGDRRDWRGDDRRPAPPPPCRHRPSPHRVPQR